jgi:hypothetical protein
MVEGVRSEHVFDDDDRGCAGWPVSELRSALEPLRAEELRELPDARIEEDFAELHRMGELVELERLRRLAELERRRAYARDGHLSAAAWLADRFGVAWGSAREQVRTARGLGSMPGTRAALDAGELTLGAARVLVAAREAEPEVFADAEERLVAAGRIHTVGALQRVVAHWRRAVERDRGRGEEEVHARRALHASVTLEGMVRVDGDLDPVGGESLLTALRAVLDTEVRARGRAPDPRTPAQRRADALSEICRQWLDREDRPSVGGERPHLTLTVPIEALGSDGGSIPDLMANGERRRAGGVEPARSGGPELDHTGPVGPETVRALACDAAVLRVVMAGRSTPLDVGRRTPVIPPGMRRAVMVRDRTCRFPGCDRPHTWCDAHHVIHWADGGPTSAANLLLLCRAHHRLVHRRGGFTLELVDGAPVFRRPDGSPLEGRAPPQLTDHRREPGQEPGNQ